MRKQKPLIGAALAAPALTADQAAYEKAEAALEAAEAVGAEWRDSRKMLKQAAEAAAMGDFDKAVNLTETAGFQGMMGKKQAQQEDNVGNPAYRDN